MPLDFSNNLYGAYEVFKGLNGISISVLSSQNDLFKVYDEFFKSNTQRYENYIKYYVGIINDGNV